MLMLYMSHIKTHWSNHKGANVSNPTRERLIVSVQFFKVMPPPTKKNINLISTNYKSHIITDSGFNQEIR